ncbi:MAG: hypothetical protein COB89_03920 [Piscirickettsiaceae bacterium]|nr:MAG: hypothetical protein COB89_07875 [Piscirickettsiaceae bacterium]PCH84915.1 MAG: hypothetical protein COB89_03920 [Piscirickettsiaceae bacterium]
MPLNIWLSSLFILSALLTSSFSIAGGQELKINIKRSFHGVSLRGEIDYRQKEGNLFSRHYDAGIRLPIPTFGEGWSFGAHYRAIYTPAARTGWDLEKRPYIQLQKAFTTKQTAWLPNIKWAIRTRQESRFRQNKDNSRRNRVRIYLKYLKPLWGGSPFLANEYYYDFRKDKLTKARLDIGLEFSKIAGIKPSLYYKYTRTYKNRHWAPYSALVLKLSF